MVGAEMLGIGGVLIGGVFQKLASQDPTSIFHSVFELAKARYFSLAWCNPWARWFH